MRTSKTLTLILLFPLTVTATSAAAGFATGSDLSAQEETAEPEATAQRSDDEEPRRREVVRFRGRDAEPFAWSFGYGGARGYLGVGVVELTPELRRHFGAPAYHGVMVSKVVDDSPAAAAGIAVGDILLSVDDESIDGEWDLILEIGKHEEGETASIEVLRDGTRFSVTPMLEERDRQVVDLMPLLRRDEMKENLRELHGLRIEVPEVDVKEMEKVIAIRDEDIERAMGALQKRLDSPQFRERIAEAARRSAELERRTAELERRLAELQRRLDRLQAQENP